MEILDIIGELFSDEISIAVSNGKEYVYYRPSKRIDLKIRPGDPVKEGTIAHKAYMTKQKISEFIDRNVFGVPYHGMAVPFHENGEVAGCVLAIFVTKSIAKGGDISSVVPFVSHVDHTEHDVDVVVTEQGYADLRGLAPRERVPLIIENCVHPMYRPQLWKYYEEALERGGQTPHVLEKAFSWPENYAKNGTMLEKEAVVK